MGMVKKVRSQLWQGNQNDFRIKQYRLNSIVPVCIEKVALLFVLTICCSSSLLWEVDIKWPQTEILRCIAAAVV